VNPAQPFQCPTCTETYQPHWRDKADPKLCRTCGERRDGFCKWADEHPQHLDQHPCSTSEEEPGSPCRYCATPVPANGDPCPKCWLSFDGMNIADIKAVFAADAEAAPEGEAVFEVRPAVNPEAQR
jgi:hypothetical protein